MVNNRLEKYSIFSQGFRGLPDGWHNLRSFNFLVGENSTGKSSFLQLIEIIDSQQHLFFLELLGVAPGIDSVFDVCTRSGNSSEITIGFLLRKRERKAKRKSALPDSRVFGRLITYKKVKDNLRIISVTIAVDNAVYIFRRIGGSISFKKIDWEYDTESRHIENARRFSEIHSSPQLRLKATHASDIDSSFSWLTAIGAQTSREAGDSRFSLVLASPPLNCLQYGPLRGKTRRLYYGIKSEFSSTGEHFAFMVKNAMSNRPELMSSIEDFGKASGLFDKLSVVSMATKVKDKPFAFQLEKAGSFYYVDELGFGVGQILPIVADLAISSSEVSFLVQQPELHLHPRAQAALGDVFLRAVSGGRMLVVETHSDFIIDRFRVRHKQMGEDAPSAQIVYFEKDPVSGKNVAHEINLLSDGGMSNVPDSYRGFFMEEKLDLFENL